MQQFINAPGNLVTDSLDGLLMSSGGANLARLDGYPSIKVVLRTDHKASHVAVIAGGGSGHEPAHAGFVGKGLLTAAVCGEVFASPSVDAVFAAIMAVTGKAGCLLILKNYTGDRLNFGLAAERARALGKKVEMLIVADDIALPDIPQPRGIAGVVFVEKIAGHYAAKGMPLEKVAAMARAASQSLVSLGIALGSCTVPGHGREDRIPAGKAELGLGIHGEPGVDLIDFKGAQEAARLLMQRLFEKVQPARSYALLINNLGSTTPLEMGLIAKEALSLKQSAKIKLVCGPAALVTSLDMHGFSLSLMPLKPAYEEALRSPVNALVWPTLHSHVRPRKIKLGSHMEAKPAKASQNAAVEALLKKACKALIAAESDLNTLDAQVGDGDTGSTIATAARHVQSHLGKLPMAKPHQLFMALSDSLSRTMGGSSGVLLAILFSAAARASAGGDGWHEALSAGVRKMMAYGGAQTGDRTMLDALVPALEALKKGSLRDAAQAARAGADATAKMKRARAGRSAYVSERNLAGINDPGAEAVARLMAALAED